MKVMFLQHVVHVGKKWEIKEVKDAYARNFLIPKKMARQVTPALEKQLEATKKQAESNRREILSDAGKIVQKIDGQKLSFTLWGSPSGKVYGSIGEKDIISEIKKHFQVQLSKKHIDFPSGHIKQFGEHFVYVNFGQNKIAKLLISLTLRTWPTSG